MFRVTPTVKCCKTLIPSCGSIWSFTSINLKPRVQISICGLQATHGQHQEYFVYARILKRSLSDAVGCELEDLKHWAEGIIVVSVGYTNATSGLVHNKLRLLMRKAARALRCK